MTREERKKLEKAAKAAGHPFKHGDVLVCSWGYDQTNVDFVRVIKVTKSSVWLEKLETLIKESETNSMQGRAMAGGPKEGEPVKRYLAQVTLNDKGKVSHWYLKADYGYWYLWDFTPKNCSWYA